MKSHVLILLFSLFVNGASGVETDVVESVSVIVGDSFTLHTDVTQRDGVIEWRFGEDLIARINSESNNIKILVNDNEFGDRVQLDDQTGDLKISNIKINDFGLYKLEVNSGSGLLSKTFNVSGVSNLASDGVKLVPVLERDSVILHSGLTEIQRDDQITWKFEETLISQLNNQTAEIFADVLDGRFKDRLKLNQMNGSLIITDIRPNTSGLYVVEITKIKSSYTTHKTFRVTIIDGGNRLSVMEGTSVTLESGVPKIHRYDVIIWRCEHGDSVIAKMTFGIFATFDGADGRFRGTLELNYKTGSLTIRNIRTKHAGLYHLDITGNITLFKRINISVYSQDRSLCVIAVIGVAFLLLVAAVAIALLCCRNRGSRQTGTGTWKNPEHQDILLHSITPHNGEITEIPFTQLHSERTYSERMISPALTEMVVQFSGIRRRTRNNSH
ncbi:uncharacterized protein LOC125261187 isoform X1 [Megalobrama amblycephala]|uniref:uncharacterized protein LOC125261187 isoform X1 n=1 Tax=Megalobrama amblycephala TaxID=75352 RepID=UPI0020143B80|nr:uncharacterized protein LOC125261187 isoform X1 [Megalobrama amblycephala]